MTYKWSIKTLAFGLLLQTMFACNQEKYVQGKRIYDAYCLQCHMEDGSGLGKLYPDLSKSSLIKDNLLELPCLIRHGRQSVQLSTVAMPAHKNLKEAELSNLINYLSDRWGVKKPILITDVRNQLDRCP